ncbi:MAG TPA: 2,3,4,5-tetrahydropyridine-2,6-dicarboxylate N-succinyltransferase, partial [Myxococcaceae bacterium]|nr:2,3,4,5-tetrahydropyridine-2,6-dicarboxylate N-succinyltransferase [Myxococcaceae bacterium]
MDDLRERISAAFADRALLKDPAHVAAVREVVALLDAGRLRVAEKGPNGWSVNAWVKEAILLFFAISEMEVMEVGPFEFRDKVPLKKNLEGAGVRVVPPGTIRY